MIWGAETPGQSDKFEAKTLPPAEILDPESTAVVGVGAVAPREDAKGEAAGRAETGASAGKAAWRRRLSPHHRDAVKAFFTRPPAAPNAAENSKR